MSEPLITHLTTLFQADLDAKNDAAMQQMAAEWLKVEDRLRSQIELLAAELASPPTQPLKLDPITEIVVKMQDAGYAPDKIQQLLATQGIFKIPDVPQPQAKQIKDWQLAKLQRYVRLLAQVQQEIEQFTGKTATPVIDQLLADSALAGLHSSLVLIDATLSAGGADVIGFGFDRLGIEAVQNIIAIAGAGKPLGDLLQAAYPLAAGGITDKLIYGTAVGWNPRKTARAIINEGLAQGLNHILLLARDQQIRSYREAGRQSYLRAGIIAYKRLCAKQSRTCLACLALDGTIWPTEELMALHAQDRCSQTPIIPGLDPITTESGEAWFNRQSPEVQRQMMGPGKYAAWKAGKFDFKQLATVRPNRTWGPSAQVTSLRDLLDGKGGFTPPPIPHKPPAPKPPIAPGPQPAPSPLPALDHDALVGLDLHQVGPGWGTQADWRNQSYGGIIFDDQGRVLLRKPTGNFDGYAWTFPKGRMDGPEEHPVLTALREVEQESGHTGAIIGLLPGQYQAGRDGTKNNFFLMKSNGFDVSKMDAETEQFVWATWSEAEKLIKQGTNKAGVERDLKILNAAIVAHGDLETGFATNDYLFKKPKTQPAILTTFPEPLLQDIEAQIKNKPVHAKTALINLQQNGKGLATLDGTGKLKSLMSFDDTEDNYLHVSAAWAETQVSAKTAIINAGKAAIKQSKGIYITTAQDNMVGQLKKMGFEQGGPGKLYGSGTWFLPPEWIKDWAKAPTQFPKLKTGKGLKLPEPPPPPKTLDRFNLPGGDPTTDDLKTTADLALADPLAKKGAATALDKIKGGQKGFVYSDKSGAFKGVISYEEQSGIVKVGSAGFADFETNLAALQDVVKVAQKAGKDMVTFAPSGPVLEQYKKWGFATNNTYPNGESLILKSADIDAWLKGPEAFGKTVKSTAKKVPAPAFSAPPPPVSSFKATPKPRPVEAIPDPAPLPEPDDFPPDPLALKVVRKLGGSTGAELVEGPDGRLYVRKKGASAEHVREESHADAAYLAAGANVPRFRLYDEVQGGPVKLAEFVEGQSLAEVLKKGGKKAQAARKAVQDLFAADALFSNRDVVGLDYDNILVDKSGRVWRIDNGGSFRFRAQGARKQDWDEYPTDFWTLRDKGQNPQTGDVFEALDFYAISDQVLELGKRRAAILAAAPAQVQEVLARRLDHIKDMAATGKAMQGDDFQADYADSFSRQRMEIRRGGLTEQMPLALDVPGYEKTTRPQRYTGAVDTTAVYDEQGRRFDRLRGSGSLMGNLRDFVNKAGGDYGLIARWAEDQAGSSWSRHAQAFKHYISRKLGKADGNYWWRDGQTMAERHYADVAKDTVVYDRTFQALHAFTLELLHRIDFPNKDAARGTVQLFRTEDKSVLKRAGLKPGDAGVTMARGAVESTSIFDAVYIGTSELTRQDVPLHRVVGTYFTERQPGSGYGMFYGDHENEFVVILGGDLPFDYVATKSGSSVAIP